MRKFFRLFIFTFFFLLSTFTFTTFTTHASAFTDILNFLTNKAGTVQTKTLLNIQQVQNSQKYSNISEPQNTTNLNTQQETNKSSDDTFPKTSTYTKNTNQTKPTQTPIVSNLSPAFLDQLLLKIKNNPSLNQNLSQTLSGQVPAQVQSSLNTLTQQPLTSLGQLSSSLFGGGAAGGAGGLGGGLTPFGGNQQMSAIANGAMGGILNFAQSLCKQGGGTNCDQARAQAGQAMAQIQNGVQNLATPYNGPGGSLPGDCGIPKGPIAYNIGNKSGVNVACNAKSVVSGYMGHLRKDKFGIGYVNPMRESGDHAPGTIKYKCTSCGDGEYRYPDYGSPDAIAYMQKQLLHWQDEGKAKGQSCVPVDIDNCDAIGNANYKKILDMVELLNNKGDTKIKVLNKNPQDNCNFMSHPAVVGAFIEEISVDKAKVVAEKMRSKPEQILVFASGSGSKSGPSDQRNQNVKKIENSGIKNASFSYDSGSEYQTIYDCTYKE